MIFTSHNKVRIHDTDMAGRLYFAKQFRFVNDAMEDFMASEGSPLHKLIQDDKHTFAMVHAEADYLKLLQVGDHLEIQVACEKIGTTSFALNFKIFKEDKTLCGTARTIQVALDNRTGKKMPLPLKSSKSYKNISINLPCDFDTA